MLLKCVKRSQLTVSSTAVVLVTTDFTPNRKTDSYSVYYADIQVTGANVRYTSDGATTATTAIGTIWYKGQIKRVWGETNLKNLSFIRDDSTDAVLEIEYFGGPPK